MRTQTAIPVKLPSGEGWHYASLSDRGGHPIGYCATHPPHATEAEARKCYQDYQRDRVRLSDQESSSWSDCSIQGCGNPAKKEAHIEGDGYHSAVFCDEHFTLENAIKALHLDEPEAGDSWRS